MHADVSVSFAGLFGFLTVLARVSGALAFVPLPGIRNAVEPVRAFLALGLTVALAPLWPSVVPAEPVIGTLLVWMASEAALGAAIGLAVAFLIEGLLVAAQVIGLQAGYSYASTIDPTTEADSNVLLIFANLTAGLLFFALGLDREIIRVFAASLTAYPPGTFVPKMTSAQAIIGLGSDMLATGVRLALPVVVLLMLIDIALALLGRMHQQLQLITLAFPVKMAAALAFLSAISILFIPVYGHAAQRTFAALARLF